MGLSTIGAAAMTDARGAFGAGFSTGCCGGGAGAWAAAGCDAGRLAVVSGFGGWATGGGAASSSDARTTSRRLSSSNRLVVARDLLTETGSIFVQIGDENVHLVRSLLDEVFGSENFCAEIDFSSFSLGTATDWSQFDLELCLPIKKLEKTEAGQA